MLVKLGVCIERLKRPARRALSKVEEIFKKHGEEAVITSTFEGNHSASSLHYADLAFDLRLPKKNLTNIERELKTTLGQSFDVIVERNHFHIEYDPK